MDERKSATMSRPFFSLKWKALLFLSLVLALVNGSFYFLQSASLRDQFARERSLLHERNAIAARTLIEQSAQQLQRVGELLPEIPGVRDSLVGGDSGALEAALDKNPSLQLGQNIDVLAFYDTSGHPAAIRRGSGPLPSDDSPIIQRIRQATTREAPVAEIDCAHSCIQYVIVPVLAQHQVAGTLLLGSSLANITVGFQKIADADIGIILLNPQETNRAAGRQTLALWEADILALTRAQFAYGVLKQATNQSSLVNALATGVVVENDGRASEVRLIPIAGLAIGAHGFLAIIHDVTNQVAYIRDAAANTLLAGILGLVLSEGILLLVAWTPLSRLKRTASLLPLLARGEFDGIRTAIGRPKSAFAIRDEIDQLDDTAFSLSYQLEELQNEISKRTNALSEKMNELTRERDFVKGLLETAQVIVVTTNADGNILTINRFGETLCGRPNAELQGTRFSALFTPTSDVRPHGQNLESESIDKLKHWRQEMAFDGPGAVRRHIDWIHSRLAGNSATDAAVLSVGLDVTERKRAEQRIAWLADHDPLTGLHNRRRFQEEFENIVSRSVRYKRQGALLFIDLDNFKYINDTRGHAAGDSIIKEVSKELSQILRRSDRIARLGGDEFAVAMPELGRDDAIGVARKINDRLSALTIPGTDRKEKITSSIGVVLFPDHGSSAEELLANADLAMYQAKENGRSRWHLFAASEQARERIQTQVLWKQRIEDSLSANGFLLHYQPISNIQQGTISHYEVLLRMLGPSGAIIYPTSFIGIAERVGLIRSIDHMVLKKTVKMIGELPADRRDLTFSLNLSAHSFTDPELLPLLEDLLSSSQIDPNRLIFEITETAALADFEAASSLIKTMQSMGCKFAIDDFGVGFSSFYYLKQLPVEYVKIDGSFIKNLSENRDDQVLVKAMGEIARGFGKKTVAEYVESAATLDLLRDYSIDYAQGFFIGRPNALIAPASKIYEAEAL